MPVKGWSCQWDGGQAGKEQELLSSMSFIYTQLDQNLVSNLNMRKFRLNQLMNLWSLSCGMVKIGFQLRCTGMWSSCYMYLIRCVTVTIFYSFTPVPFFFVCARCLLRSGYSHFGIDAGILRMWYNIQESVAFWFIWMENENNHASCRGIYT